MWFVGNSGGTARYHFSFGQGATNGVTLYANNASSGATSAVQTTAIALNTNAIIGFTISAAGSSVNVNGNLTSFPTMSATSANDTTWLQFGDARNEFVTDVNIYEFIGFNRDLTTAERQQVQGYLSQKWGVGSLSPAPSKYAFSSFPSASVVPFLPTDILGCTIWLDGNDPAGTGTQPANDASISSWVDKSGNSKNMSVYAGTPVFNTYPSRITFNGSTSLINSSFTSEIFTLFIVYLQTTATGPVYTTSTTQEYSGFWPNEAGTTYFTRMDNNSWYTQTSTLPINTRRILVIQYTAAGAGGNMYVWSNGILNISTTTLGTRTVTSLLLGSRPSTNAFINGNYSEVIQYDSVLTTAQRQAVEGYLSSKWQISLGYYIPSPLVISGCRLWLDGADPSATGVQPSNGASVSTWVDKSGNSNSPTSSSGTYPTYTSASRAVTWAGGAAQLTFPTSLHSAVVGTAFTVFFVEQRTTGSENFIIRGTTQSTNSNLLIGHGGGLPSTSWRFAFYNNDLDFTSLPSYSAGESATVSCFMYSDPNRAIYHNGSITASASDTNSSDLGSWTGAMIGGNSIWPAYFGNVFEMLIYNRALTTTERQQVEGYLAWKWGLRTSLPTAHPYYTQQHPYNKIPPPARSPDAAAPSFSAVGGAIVVNGGFTYHVFVASSSFVATGSKTVNYLLVGGGGGGGDRHGGGGGAGGVLTGTFSATSGTYTVTVGAGGAGGDYEANNSTPRGSGIKGGDTTVTGLSTANGGGGGGTYDGNPTGTVGSGGGGGGNGFSGVAGTSGQGNAGGTGSNPGGGGGGGAGGAGVNANTGTGGVGTTVHSTTLLAVGYGTSFAIARPPNIVLSGGLAYIAGGGGGAAAVGGANGGFGGLGGGGRGDWDNAFISAGTPNTGGGGGASRSENGVSSGFAGGSGLVVLWY
jgi:hypothetical protein